eukprot:Skav206459  [mRNA]  locus=scaffold2468:14555:14929:- [translate_table: standard]
MLSVDVGAFAEHAAPEAALKVLLQGRSEYHTPDFPVSLARFSLERISLPETLEGVPEVASLLPEEARQYLELPEFMIEAEDFKDEPIVPYVDPALKVGTQLQITDKEATRLEVFEVYGIKFQEQ